MTAQESAYIDYLTSLLYQANIPFMELGEYKEGDKL